MEIKDMIAHNSNYGSKRNLSSIQYIVIHYTGNTNDKAASNCKYFQSPNRNASAHYFVGSDGIYRSVKDDIVAWSVGGRKYPNCDTTGGGKWYGKCTNNNSISIEMCDSADSVPNDIRDMVRELVLLLMKKYNISEGNIIRHFDVIGKNCPASLINNSKWTEFKTYVTKSDDMTTSKIRVDLFGGVRIVDSINIDGFNHVKLRDLECSRIKIGWDGNNVLVNGRVFNVDGILNNGYNYIKVRSLEAIGVDVDWDDRSKTIILN